MAPITHTLAVTVGTASINQTRQCIKQNIRRACVHHKTVATETTDSWHSIGSIYRRTSTIAMRGSKQKQTIRSIQHPLPAVQITMAKTYRPRRESIENIIIIYLDKWVQYGLSSPKNKQKKVERKVQHPDSAMATSNRVPASRTRQGIGLQKKDIFRTTDCDPPGIHCDALCGMDNECTWEEACNLLRWPPSTQLHHATASCLSSLQLVHKQPVSITPFQEH